MIFHVIGAPQSMTTSAYSMCGFSHKTICFCKMMKDLGHKVLLYAGEENEAVCDEHIVCFNEEDRKNITQDTGHYASPSWDMNHITWRSTNEKVINEIKKRAGINEFICTLQGNCQKQIADALPELKTVEYGIGYDGFFSKWKVFESHAWRSYCVGRWLNTGYSHLNDTVIHGFFDETRFKPSFTKKPYALFVGRISQIKGIEDCCLAAQIAGIPLKVAGHGNLNLISNGAEYIGQPSLEERNKLMAEATVVMCPSRYFEPFGNVACEAQFSGTPVISSDWGGYTESVEHAKSGYRCSTVADMVKAINNIDKIDNHYVLDRAIKLFSTKSIMHKYQEYFTRLLIS